MAFPLVRTALNDHVFISYTNIMLINPGRHCQLTDCPQEGDMIIPELKRKTKGPLGIMRKSIAGRNNDAMTT